MAVSNPNRVNFEQQYSEKTDAIQVSIPTTRKDIASLSVITFTVNAGEIWEVELFIPWLSHDTVARGYVIHITDNAGADATANVKATAFSGVSGVANGSCGATRALERITAAGTYSRKGVIQAVTTASNSSNGIQVATSASFQTIPRIQARLIYSP